MEDQGKKYVIPNSVHTVNENHPSTYDLRSPNVLLDADVKFSDVENKIYTSVFRHKHDKRTHDVLEYAIPLKDFTDDFRNIRRTLKKLQEELNGRSLQLTKEQSLKIKGINATEAFAPITNIREADLETEQYNERTLVFTINRTLKDILVEATESRLPYTRGEYELLKTLPGVNVHKLYWYIRSQQHRRKSFSQPLEVIKRYIGLSEKYTEWRAFRRRVLEPARDLLKGTWAEFDYEPVKKGNKVVGLQVYLKNGPEEEKNVPIGSKYVYEQYLVESGCSEGFILNLRNKIDQEFEVVHIDNNQLSTKMCEGYIDHSFKHVARKYKKLGKDGMAPYLNKAILGGIYVESYLQWVEKEKALANKDQLALFKSKGNE